ncbi:hypothetical protein EOE67_17430 [Rheinheimera riviphila]|uniref:Uncharacterized protein n=1 Tax=Rheinheimera riviphila TaxID=1834037 RepID=A0A437QFC5_9GAMM|nr:hypothetical protein [Rheinheimera riviphila]RVU33241.1 hypothetical protein EOE67_17430 [Rheinheimera riviphila]
MDSSLEVTDMESGNFDYRKRIIEKLLGYIEIVGTGDENVIEISEEIGFYYAIAFELNDYYVIGLINKIEVLTSEAYFGDMDTR